MMSGKEIKAYAEANGMVLENHWISVGDVGHLSAFIEAIELGQDETRRNFMKAAALGEIARCHFENIFNNPEAKEP